MDKTCPNVPVWAMHPAATVEVRLLALPESTPTTLFAFLEVFSAVGIAWAQITGETGQAPRMQVRVVARERSPWRSPVGPVIAPDLSLEEATAPADIVIVTDLDLTAGLGDPARWRPEAAWLRAQAETGATLCSVCTGSVVLASTGLLDGGEATTHWAAADLMREAFPEVRLRPERILCASGPEQRLVTGGGPGSWEDLALHLIARFCGPEEAVRIARVFVLGDRSRGQLLFSLLGRPRHHADAPVAAAQEWIAENYAMKSPVARMVARSGLPERSFKRRFRAATGYAPVDYVQAVRIEEAKHLLETSDIATDAVAFEVGYDDPSYFHRLFRRKTGVTPGAYRRHFARVVRPHIA
ncbi:transcriptional regulator, AraC family with amidase-like domain [Maritimibacter sp. HL-12]|nr:transcriptional regulator, AraC family with amidase-like domain [Maritimibacter sp. HL-12]